MKNPAAKPSNRAQPAVSRGSGSLGRVASVADTKANLTALLREVETHHIEITVLRRGVPVAKIAPIDDAAPISGYGWMRGSVQEIGDIVGPTGEVWDLSDDAEDLA